ncbi:unnamed protein product [Brassica rapa subsp. narinosa]
MELDLAGGEAVLKPHSHRQKHTRSSTRTARSESLKSTAEANLCLNKKAKTTIDDREKRKTEMEEVLLRN